MAPTFSEKNVFPDGGEIFSFEKKLLSRKLTFELFWKDSVAQWKHLHFELSLSYSIASDTP